MPGDVTIVSGRRVAERYRLLDKRPDGAWTAVDETLRRNVVVHVLPSDAAADAKEHFTAEARCLARLNHPNIVCTYDTGVDGDGTSYRIDELAAGSVLDLHNVEDRDRVAYALQIVRAIADAHDAGLVHGNLGSHSVLVDDGGRAMLRGLRLPDAGQADGLQRADLAALVDLVIALASTTPSPLRDVAVAWRRTPPSSARAMLDDVAGIPDETLQTIPPHVPTPAVGVPATRRGRGVWVAIATAVVIAGVLFAVVLPAQRSHTTFAGPITDLHVAAKSFDPEAKPPTERENEAGLAVDGKQNTGWRTDRYHSAAFGNLKHGVGLILQPDAPSEIASVTLASSTRGWTVEVFVADEPAETLAGWGRALGTTKVQTPSTTIALGDVRGGAVLVWITNLGPSQQVRITEATVQGRVGK